MTVRTPAGTHDKGWQYGLYFDAPPGTSIRDFSRQIEGNVVQVGGAPPPWSWTFAEGGMIVGQDSYVQLAVAGNTGPFQRQEDFVLEQRLRRLQFSLICSPGQGGPCQDNGSVFTVRRVTTKLDDLSPPRIVQSSGSLLTPTGPQRGQRHLALSLKDTGGGLYFVRVEVDGERINDLPIDSNEGACKRPFLQPVPCKLAAAIDVPVDTTRLTEGHHSITVRVFDATAVNSASVGPISLYVDNEPDPLPRGTSACPSTNAAKVHRRLTAKIVRFGRATSIVGRVAAPRATLKTARVGVVDNAALSRRPALVRMSRKGRFRVRIRPMRSTTVRPVMVSSAGEARACGKPLAVRVRAGVRFAIRPRHLRNGASIRLGGRVLGQALPSRGKTVAIQARARGASAWTTVTLVRSTSTGEFAFSYRFRKTFRTTTYDFRALVPRERTYPYLRGWSRIRRATVSP